MEAQDLIGRCGFCGRDFTANTGARLARHGYRRHRGWFSGSCPGSGMLALERSVETLTMLADALARTIERGTAASEDLPAAELALEAFQNVQPGGFAMTEPKDSPTMKRWTELKTKVRALRELVTHGQFAAGDLPRALKAITEWKQTELRPQVKPVDPAQCPGSGTAPVERFYLGARGRCSTCGKVARINRNGQLAKHSPKEQNDG